jgi:hypothetical protein
MAPEERMSAKNGLWMCSNCHSLIDRDTEAYPLKKLRQMKKEGEERARQEVGMATVVSLYYAVGALSSPDTLGTRENAPFIEMPSLQCVLMGSC